MSEKERYRHWRRHEDEDRVLWLYLDKDQSNVNTLDQAVMIELSQLLDELAQEPTCQALIIASGKKNGFIAGADIKAFNDLANAEVAVQLLQEGQRVFAQLAALRLPTVAMIQGFCLGGGLELALACHYRVAEESHSTRLGLPEVRLGIQPGWGGSVRLARLIGGVNALDLILSGRMVGAKKAAALGFIDAAVPARHLITAAKYYALQKPPLHQASLWQTATNMRWSRWLLSKVIRRQLRAKANPDHYPAPFQILENWEHHGVVGDQPFETEAQSCARLFLTEASRNLVRVFFLQERLKGLSKAPKGSQQHVHVIGAGTMGADIAAWCAIQGFKVTLQDVEPTLLARAFKRAYAICKDKLKENYLIQKAMDGLIPDIEGKGVASADVIIEAVIEDLLIKQQVFKTVEKKAKANALLATNTSSIPLDEINSVLQNPGRLLGIHFFNPVAMMQLVEVVTGKHTDPAILEKAITFVRQIDKLPLPVKSSPGFLVNRILFPYMMEAMHLLENKVPARVIDQAMVNFGMPMGPVALADVVGLDVCLSVAEHLSQYFKFSIPERLKKAVADKKLGRKTGEGFYRYTQKGEIIETKSETSNRSYQEIANQLVLRLIHEAFQCLHEKVVADADLLDAGMIFATGFAPFRGGPIHYAQAQGIQGLFAEFVRQRQAQGETIDSTLTWDV